MNVELMYLQWDEVALLEKNARFMRHEQYQQLVENIRRDGALSSTPFAWWNPGLGKWEVLSGNHRTKAGQEAGLPGTHFLVTRDPLTPAQRRVLQLSHNAIAGEDDLGLLRELYEEVDDLALKRACGLDDKTLKLLAELEPDGKPSASLEWTVLSFAFLPDEAQAIRDVLTAVQATAKGETFAARMKDYDEFMDALAEVSTAAGIKNSATALRMILDLFGANLTDLQQLYAEQDGEQGKKTKKQAPLSSVLGARTVSAHTAMILARALERGLEKDRTGTLTREDVLRQMAELYLAHLV